MALIYDRPNYHHCECGFDSLDLEIPDGPLRKSAQAKHRREHAKYERGIEIKAKSLFYLTGDGVRIVKVRGDQTGPLADTALRLARAASRAGGYMGPTYYPGDASTDAYLYILDGHAVGYLATLRASTWARVKDLHHERGEKPCAYHIFVAAEHRRRGIAGALLDRYASDEGVPLSEIAFGHPFSTAGMSLGKALCGDDLLVGG